MILQALSLLIFIRLDLTLNVSGLLGIKTIDKDFNMVKPELLRWSQGFSLLSEPIRLNILKMLSGGPKSAHTLCQGLRHGYGAIRHHLGLLQKGGLVQKKRQGGTIVYSAEKGGLKTLAAAIAALKPRYPIRQKMVLLTPSHHKVV